jgi:hypothetical protein
MQEKFSLAPTPAPRSVWSIKRLASVGFTLKFSEWRSSEHLAGYRDVLANGDAHAALGDCVGRRHPNSENVYNGSITGLDAGEMRSLKHKRPHASWQFRIPQCFCRTYALLRSSGALPWRRLISPRSLRSFQPAP